PYCAARRRAASAHPVTNGALVPYSVSGVIVPIIGGKHVPLAARGRRTRTEDGGRRRHIVRRPVRRRRRPHLPLRLPRPAARATRARRDPRLLRTDVRA